VPLVHSQLSLGLERPDGRASLEEYGAAFDDWLKGQAQQGGLRRTSSREMYAHMWSAWSRWAVDRNLRLMDARAAELDSYLQSRGAPDELSSRYAWRLLRLVERVLGQYASSRGLTPNLAAKQLMTARPDIRFANAPDTGPAPEYLDAAQAKQLVTFISAVLPARSSSPLLWQEVRDRASIAVMLGAGLTPGEVRALQLADVISAGGKVADLPWKLKVAGNGNAPARETPVAAWAGRVVQQWLQVRTQQEIPGKMLFPSTRSSGKPWGKVAQYNAARQIMANAGVDTTEGGSFRLRHTFALRQLRRGKTPDEVASWLGVTNPSVMARYQRILLEPVDLA
jgi:integrase